MNEIEKLINDIKSTEGFDNTLDVRIEVALFKPDSFYTDCRPNHAMTKVIYTSRSGIQGTYWAAEWTANRPHAINLLTELLK